MGPGFRSGLGVRPVGLSRDAFPVSRQTDRINWSGVQSPSRDSASSCGPDARWMAGDSDVSPVQSLPGVQGVRFRHAVKFVGLCDLVVHSPMAEINFEYVGFATVCETSYVALADVFQVL